ncbi:MAG: hypothetical protein ACI9YE_003464 [Psychroserpens sp.]|jgi:hypothetical protein
MIQTFLFLFIYIYGAWLSLAKHPAIIFCVYQLVFFFNPQERWWGSSLPSFSYSFPIAVLLLILTIKEKMKKDNVTNSFNNPLIKWLFVFLIVFILVYFNAVFAEKHLIQIQYFIQSFIILVCAYVLATDMEKVKWYIQSFILGSFYLAFYTYQTGRTSGDRVDGIGVLDSSDSNSVAVSLMPGAIFALHYLFLEKALLKKVYYALACIFIANALVLINSRGAMLGILAGGAFYLLQISRGSAIIRYARLKAIGLIILSISGAMYLADDSTVNRFYSIFSASAENTEVESGATRTHFWKASIDMATDHPLGLGFRGFNAFADLYIPQEVNTGGSRARSVHSSWFEALSEVGYLGLSILLYLVYLSFKLSKKAKQHFKVDSSDSYFFLVVALQAAIIGTVVSMSFISRMRGETFMWLLIFVAATFEIIKRSEKKARGCQ